MHTVTYMVAGVLAYTLGDYERTFLEPLSYFMRPTTDPWIMVGPPKGLFEAMDTFIGDAAKKGQFVDGAALQPTAAGSRVTLKTGQITVTDGPFTQSKEIVGGYAIIDAKSRGEAVDLARQFMEPHRSTGRRSTGSARCVSSSRRAAGGVGEARRVPGDDGGRTMAVVA